MIIAYCLKFNLRAVVYIAISRDKMWHGMANGVCVCVLNVKEVVLIRA